MKIKELTNFTLKELLGVKFYDEEGKFEFILLDLVNEQKGLFLIKNIKDWELSKRVCQCDGDGNSLLLAAGKHIHPAVFSVRQSYHLQ